jgi:hypothetical protein
MPPIFLSALDSMAREGEYSGRRWMEEELISDVDKMAPS